jgi:hypothetical protein
MPGAILGELFELWNARDRSDEYFGTLVNAYLANGGVAEGVRAGDSYVDIGTLDGYRSAIGLLSSSDHDGRMASPDSASALLNCRPQPAARCVPPILKSRVR